MKPAILNPRAIGAAVSALIAAFTASMAAAQADLWLVTEVGPADAKQPRDAGAAAAGALRAEGREALDPDRAAALYEERSSKAPVYLEQDQVDKLQQAISEVAHHLALENLAKAQEALATLKALTPEVADFLNRKMERAEQMFQSCLLLAHLMHKGGYRDKAFRQVADCARDFPGFEPDKQYYPPHIQEIFKRAVAELNAAPAVAVYVGVTSGEQCRVRINGIDWGPAPANVPGIRAKEVRIQVDCRDQPGRIYRKELQPGRNELVIDPRFDAALRTGGGLRLSYDSAAQAEQNSVADNLRAARVVGATQVLQIDLFHNRLRRLDVAAGRETASVGFTSESLAPAVKELLAQKPSAAPVAQGEGAVSPSPLDAALRPEEPRRDRGAYYRQLWGWVGAGLSAGAIAAGWVYWFKRVERRNQRLDAGDLREYDGFRAPILAFTGAGSLGLTASLVFALPKASGAPWWSWLIGAAGAGLATYGIYSWARPDKDCRDPECLDFTWNDSLGGPFYSMQSLPLLAAPVIYLIRHWAGADKSDISAAARLEPGGGSFVLAGGF